MTKQKPEPSPKPSQLEQLKQQLKEAIDKENYEKAAALRDQIRNMELRG
jgi:protein-arginine kinase activator protein McsA